MRIINLIILSILILISSNLYGSEVSIRWYGHACFMITSKQGASMLTDPYGEGVGYNIPNLNVNIVTISHEHFDHNNIAIINNNALILRGLNKDGDWNIINKNIKDIINIKIKLREPFRPFAPSVLEESFSDFFEGPSPSPYMLFAFKVNPEKVQTIPAVVHVDGTARPQSVSSRTNPKYWKLIKAFKDITGVPVILNTSFNVQEPIVCTPDEAVNTFLKTQVDYLVLNNFIVNRNRED